MIKYLEKLLLEKTKDKNEHVLYDQWMLGKESISKKLQLIDYTFPNYTAHNASHSNSILNCLGNLFGPQAFDVFTPEDLWLLLFMLCVIFLQVIFKACCCSSVGRARHW